MKSWTVTSTGPYADGRYFIRLSPAGDPNAAEFYDLGNGSLSHVDQRSVINAGFLELTRLGELPATDPDVQASLKVTDSVIESQTASGPGWHRYGIKATGSTDGYGDCYVPDPTNCSPSGAPWFPTATGSGHPWPLLDGERAEQDLQTGDTANAVGPPANHAGHDLRAGAGARAGLGRPRRSRLTIRLGPGYGLNRVCQRQASRAASPLIWAQAQYLRLVTDLQAGSLVDQPAITADRYVKHGPPGAVKMSITSPSPAAGSPSVVSGNAAPGATIVIAVGQPASSANTTDVVSTVAGADGHFQATVPAPPGTIVVTAAASCGAHATGWAQVTVKLKS